VFLLSATASFSLDNGDKEQTSAKEPVKKVSSTGGPTGGNNLTDEQIASLITEGTDEKMGTKLQFQASFGVRNLPANEKKKYIKSGKVPFRVTCSLYEIGNINGRQSMKRLNGKAHINITDSTGKVIEKKTVPLDKMCPS